MKFVEEQLTPTPAPTPQKTNHWMWIGLCILMLLLGIGIGIVLARYLYQKPTIPVITSTTPIPDLTANWKMYTNKELSFNLKYPSDWVIDFEKENANILNLSSANSVLHLLNYEDKSINTKEYLSKLDRIGSVGVKNTKEAVVGGLNALQRLEGPFGSGFYLWSTYFKNGDSFFQITIEPKKGGEVRTEDFDIYNQILSTFKFMDVTGKSCQSDIDCGSGYTCMVATGTQQMGQDGKPIDIPKTCYPKDAPLPQ